MSHEPPYDPYIPAQGHGAAPGGASNQQNGNQRTAQLQAVSTLPPIAATDATSDRMICDDYISGNLIGMEAHCDHQSLGVSRGASVATVLTVSSKSMTPSV